MTLNDYKKLADCGFVWPYAGGILYSYWSPADRARRHNLKDVELELMKQLTCDFDYNNCVILFPLEMGYGTTMLFNNREIVIDHCTYVLDIADFLKSKGVTWSDGKKFKVDQCFPKTPMLIVNNGIATIHPNSNPLTCANKVGKKEIFFSGFLVNRIRNKTV